ncbi:hypothetical protein [uncultured Jatrophihabitans sp.]|uniref:hypothetical protein n=1 Tax=uncultured Jatrophihabitans sp. TaxID=1610747 RepID=UPI0035CC9358
MSYGLRRTLLGALGGTAVLIALGLYYLLARQSYRSPFLPSRSRHHLLLARFASSFGCAKET